MKRLLLAPIALFVFAVMLVASAGAATTPNSIVTAQTPKRGVAQLTASPGTYVTLYTAGANGSKCFGLVASNSDSVTHLLTVELYDGATAYVFAAVTLPATAGFATGIPAVSISNSANWPGLPVDGNGNAFFYLNSGDTLKVTYATAFTAGVINTIIQCQDF